MARLPDDLRAHVVAPRRVGEPAGGADRSGLARNAACGDVVRVYLRVVDGRVADAGFKAQGCPAALGTASAATELLVGLACAPTLATALREAFVARHGAPHATHGHALALYTEALERALADG